MGNVYAEMLAWSLEEQAKYIRGFVDGEGGPRFYRWRSERKGHHSPGEPHVRAITISNSDRRLLSTVQQIILDKGSIIGFARVIGFGDPQRMGVLQRIIASCR